MANAKAIGRAHHRVRAIFPAISVAIGSNLDTSIDVSFSNASLLPLSNSGSPSDEVVVLFQAVRVAFVKTVIFGTVETGFWGLGEAPTVTTARFGSDEVNGRWNVRFGTSVTGNHTGKEPSQWGNGWGIMIPRGMENISKLRKV